MDSRESYPALELIIDQLPGQESKVVDAINKTLDFLANHSYIMEWTWKNVVHEGKPSGKGDPRKEAESKLAPGEALGRALERALEIARNAPESAWSEASEETWAEVQAKQESITKNMHNPMEEPSHVVCFTCGAQVVYAYRDLHQRWHKGLK